jgi:hypothetical protein
MATAAPSEFPTSVRLTAEQSARIDQAAERWGCTRSAVMGRLADALADEEVMASVEQVTFQRQAQLPKARRFRLVAPWKGLIGITTYDFKRGDILSRDLHGAELLQKLYERHAALEALPD